MDTSAGGAAFAWRYTTWPARTAGLEVNAESRIVEEVTRLLEQASGEKRKQYAEPQSAYAQAVMAAKPTAYWRLGEQGGSKAVDATGNGHDGIYRGGVARHLPGVHSAEVKEDPTPARHISPEEGSS